MTVAADLGGVPGFGAVEAETDEPVFHADWERRVLALVLAMGATGTWTLDMSRFAREHRPRSEYLALSYYEIWLAALERLLVEHGLVTAAELAAGQPLVPSAAVRRRPKAADVPAMLRAGAPTLRFADAAARFQEGDVVRTTSVEPTGHTRLPSYARGKRGRITVVHGCHVYPDANARGLGEQPQWLYTVEFDGAELFGDVADPGITVSIDAFEPYLEPA
ncbi:nitrile hydratase subunit beta [Mycolicibacterium sp. CBMA 226]|uniref:nitrile hydratase subunit beta n=1 Tax=Mycolicibacterium sp. CBMA 226 TaxID=2606611 RepID=UPI0012DD0E3E|nr:nitrile hydratase subunit beta [Mycolicibacterium sp. CBMA 226]MUL79878.1 nitrile hydratase subunit beta [Mycolicibacterium sp. CBMA 226]